MGLDHVCILEPIIVVNEMNYANWSGHPRMGSASSKPTHGVEGGVCVCLCSAVASLCSACVLLFVASWTVAHRAPLSMGFSRQEYWRGLPFRAPEDLPDPGIQPASLVTPALAGGFLTTTPPGRSRRRLEDQGAVTRKGVWMMGKQK